MMKISFGKRSRLLDDDVNFLNAAAQVGGKFTVFKHW